MPNARDHHAIACAAALLPLLLPMLAAMPAGSARAAESYDACAGFIDSVPATITTQGVWCQRKDLSTAIANGAAITIATNNVTIDCNGFKLGGLAAGNGSNAYGILASNRQNATVRNCNIRGFNYGIYLNGGAGHLVEDNRLDNNLYVGIRVSGDNSRVRRNAVYDTGGKTANAFASGIDARADIVDNTVSGLFAATAGGSLTGIYADATGAQVRDNTVSGFDMTSVSGGAVQGAIGIYLIHGRIRVSGNQVMGGATSNINGFGIYAPSTVACLDNSIGGFTTNFPANCAGSGNVALP